MLLSCLFHGYTLVIGIVSIVEPELTRMLSFPRISG